MQTEDAAREEIRRGIRMSRDAFNRRKEIMSGGISQTLEIQIIRIWSVMQNCSSLYPRPCPPAGGEDNNQGIGKSGKNDLNQIKNQFLQCDLNQNQIIY